MEFPSDWRPQKLQFPAYCLSCKKSLEKGTQAHWSPSTKKILCVDCPRDANPSNPASSKSAPRESRTKPHTSQEMWQKLCDYATRCIEEEEEADKKLLAPYKCENSRWFHHSGDEEKLIVKKEEELIVEITDSTPAPVEFNNALKSRKEMIYGWPTVVLNEPQDGLKVAPLFFVTIEPKELEQEADDRWRFHATTEPKFNLAVPASNVFDSSVTDEIAEFLLDPLPFGKAGAFADVAERTAEMLRLLVLSRTLDPGELNPNIGPEQGIYNAAVFVSPKTVTPYTSLLEELRKLRNRNDWTTTAAAHLVSKVNAQREEMPSGPLAAPLPCNQSQEKILERLRRESLTVVTGPPGTGKTQLVVNAVANSWLDDHKVLVTSTNNTAVDVAVERAKDDICSGLLIRTGNRSVRRDVLPEQIKQIKEKASKQAESHEGNKKKAKKQLQQTAADRAQLAKKLARLDKLDEDLLAVVKKLEKTRSDLDKAAQELMLWDDRSPPKLSIDSREVERRADRLLQAWFFRHFRARLLHKRLRCSEKVTSNELINKLEQLVNWARLDQQQSRWTHELETMRDEYHKLKDAVGDLAISVQNLDKKWEEASLCAVRAETAARIRSGTEQFVALDKSRTYQFINESLESKSLCGWACTALSVKSNFSLKGKLFDLVIVDEASQCTLAAVLPLAYRAKRLAVVGDPKQLPPIVSLDDQLLDRIAVEKGLDNDDLRKRGIHHKDGSAYLAFEHALGASTLIDEHYRCHPHIARWFNRTFYNDELTVLTEVPKKIPDHHTIEWQDVDGTAEHPASGTGFKNQMEAEEAMKLLANLLVSGSTVGVVTPFRAQVQLIERLVEKRFGSSVLANAAFVCGTAHSFQGNERDAIVISAVLSPDMLQKEKGAGVAQWVEKERNLLNVAVSRARMALIVLGHPKMDKDDLKNQTLSSLRTYLRDKNKVATENPASPSGSEELLLNAMGLRNFQPSAKIDVEGYELDFALMEQGIKLNVEVDGDQHLDLDTRGRQRRQNITRDRILSKLEWEVLRIPAWRCYVEIDSVIDEIEKTRDRLLHETAPHRSD